MLQLHPLADADPAALEALLDCAFEPERRGRTAYKVRGDAQAIAALSFAALGEDGVLGGSIQCWPVAFRGDDGNAVPLVMIGPVAVAPALQREGHGRWLMLAALEAAVAHDLDDRLCLIGDPEYYGRFFGFSADLTAGWRLPGPVERRGLLARGSAVPDGAGTLGPA